MPVNDMVRGEIAGLAGVVAMVGVITTLRRALLSSEQLASAQTHPEKIVQALATQAHLGALDDRTRRILGDMIHFGYGATWGVALAGMTRNRTVSVVRHGLPLAAGLWTFGFNALLPALKAHPKPRFWGPREFVLTGAAHAAYGVAAAATLRWLRLVDRSSDMKEAS